MEGIGTTSGKKDDYEDVEGRERREHLLEVELRLDEYRIYSGRLHGSNRLKTYGTGFPENVWNLFSSSNRESRQDAYTDLGGRANQEDRAERRPRNRKEYDFQQMPR